MPPTPPVVSCCAKTVVPHTRQLHVTFVSQFHLGPSRRNQLLSRTQTPSTTRNPTSSLLQQRPFHTFPPLQRKRRRKRNPLSLDDAAAAEAMASYLTGQGPAQSEPVPLPPSQPTPDYTTYSTDDLISRITSLEAQLRQQTTQYTQEQDTQDTPERIFRPFDPDAYSSRHIALKFAYIGTNYNGYEHANGTVTAKPTIEEVLWKALRKTRLISPQVKPKEQGVVGVDERYDVVWGSEQRANYYTNAKKMHLESERSKVRLDLNWDGCQYSKCGRTDKGVSAFGQVIGIRVRSNRPVQVNPPTTGEKTSTQDTNTNDTGSSLSSSLPEDPDMDSDMPLIDPDSLTSSSRFSKPFDPINDELCYPQLLNWVLPPDIRVLAWCPDPPPTFDARFSCRERRYKYFFTNPAFCPVPGPDGLRHPLTGEPGIVREGWLDIDRMREAAKKLEGLHDFRNFCKIDPAKQMSSCVRRIFHADVDEFPSPGSQFTQVPDLNPDGQTVGAGTGLVNSGTDAAAAVGGHPGSTDHIGPKVYTFTVHGTAFLWHQVRCMVAVLFLVGQGLEDPKLVDQLLDIEKNPGRPAYEMAEDAPLVLWDCVFPDRDDEEDALHWVYNGDESTLKTGTTKGGGKFGVGGTVEETWRLWRGAKTREILTGALLDLTLSQGDGSSLRRVGDRGGGGGGGRGSEEWKKGGRKGGKFRTARTFDGGDNGRIKGKYIPVMKQRMIDSLESLNHKFRTKKGWTSAVSFYSLGHGDDDDGRDVGQGMEGEQVDEERMEKGVK